MSSNRIEKKVLLRATRERVWRAISDSENFGAWFGVEIDGPFLAGTEVRGRITPTQVDPEVARLQEPHRDKPWRIVVEQIVPMTLFSFRWHPFAVEPNRDYSKEPTTLVSFELAEAKGGVLLTITESGFEQLPPDRRAKALESNEAGWAHQARLIDQYLAVEKSGRIADAET
jgi:uncharacterized protein YndB with AHSA1/START domain